MKLEPNMYIRDTRKGKIYKLTDFGLEFRPQKTTYDFEKASHNIINLIKRNDIILGKDGKMYQVWKIYKDYVFTYSKNKYGQTITLVDYQIDKILTKEQFENNCYKIEN